MLYRRWLLFKAALCVFLALGATIAFAQSCSIPGQAGNVLLTGGTQPNTFFPGAAGAVAGATSISVGGGTGISRDILPGDFLLIIQMQGADINATDTNAYGSGSPTTGTSTVPFGSAGYAGGTSMKAAGTYEWAVATTSVSVGAGGSIGLSRGLTNSYFQRTGSSTQGKQAFQVIRVPQFSNVALNGTLIVHPWNGSTGGVLVLDVAGTLDLNTGGVTGDGRGFRGGAYDNTSPQCATAPDPIGCLGYRALIATGSGGFKGEGIAGTPARTRNQTNFFLGTTEGYVNGDLMRGAPGNAGGGGNQHKAGGGGGAGGGAGGSGGNSWNNNQVDYVGTPVGGFGGAPAGNTATRWHMGGGSGAGETGAGTVQLEHSSGAPGGALVVLRAGHIRSAGALITVTGSHGLRGNPFLGGPGGGGGGGGGGGTVVIAAGGLTGQLTIWANGGNGGGGGTGDEGQSGAGGGGGGGAVISNVTGLTLDVSGGASGGSSSLACASANCGQTNGIGGPGIVTYTGTSPGVQVGYECLPNLTIAKATTTPIVTSTTGATAGYVVTVTNNGGGARHVELHDWSLPPGWTLASRGAPEYFPPRPLAAGRLSTGGEPSGKSELQTWNPQASPLSVPAAGSNQFSLTSFSVAPITNGVPGAITFTFVASIPDTATVGTYHDGMGLSFLDPTRTDGTRTVSPFTNVNANRTGTAYSPGIYQPAGGVATTNVGGSNYSGLPGGPTGEDVRLVPDFSITKTGSTSAALYATFTYTLTPRNNGRAIGTQSFTTSQATTVTTNIGATLGASPLTVTDTLPEGITLTTPFTGANWSCSGTMTQVCTRTDANAYPIARATDYPPITATARVLCSPTTTRTINTVISTGAGETVPGNNTATLVTTSPLCANLTVTQASSGGTSVTAGSTVSYTVTVANLGPTAAPGTVVTSTSSAGLNCTAVTCSSTGGASCPASPTIGALQGAGLAITPNFPASSSVSFLLTCGVTATGQ